MGAAAGKRYSAGAIFLQVVPVFSNVQRAIEEETKNIDRALGDSMEKSGDEAGRRAGKAASKSMNEELKKGSGQFERDFRQHVDGINQALDGIDTKKLSNNLRREVAQIKRDLRDLKSVDLTVDADFRQAEAKIAETEGRLRALRDNAKIIFRADIDKALKGFAKIEAAKEAISDPVEIKVSADTKVAERQMTSFEKSFKRTAEKAASHLSGSMHKEVERIRLDLKALENLRIGVDISANRARAEIAELMGELKVLSMEDPNIDVKVDAARAFADLAAFEMALKKIDGQKVKPDFDSDSIRRGLSGITSNGTDAANTFRSFNVILLAATSIGPALIPMLGAIAGGLLAIGPAAAVAGAGLGAVLVGFSGISDVLTALQAKQDMAAKTSQTAAKQEEQGARRVADARRSAARAIESALERQKNAQEKYRKSVRDVQDAEQALRDAREAAKNDGADIARQMKENQLAIDQGLLDEFHATVTFNATMNDGAATNADKEQARINLEQAKLNMEELRAKQDELAKQKAKWDKEGVNGTSAVQNAQDALNSALQQQKSAYADLGKAAKEVDQARADGARQVRDALDQQALALEAVNTQQNNVNAAMSKLGPAGQAFSLWLFGMRDQFYAFRNDIQAVLLPAVQQAMEGFFNSKSGKLARQALINLAGAFGQFALALSKSLQGKAWQGFFQMLADLGPKISAAYGTAFLKVMEALATIMTVLAPYALDFANALARVATAFADWAASASGQKAIQDFMAWFEKNGPGVVSALAGLAVAATNLAVALTPWGTLVLKVLTKFFDLIAGLDPTVLGAVATAILVLVMASQVAYGIMTLVQALGALSALSIGPWIAGIIIFAAAFAALYEKNDKFRAWVKKAWKEISAAFGDSWNKYIKPALENFMKAGQDLLQVLGPVFTIIGNVLLWLAVHLIPIFAQAWARQVNVISWVIENILVPAIKIIAVVFGVVWEVVKGIWKAMKIGFLVFKVAFLATSKALGIDWGAFGQAIKKVWNKGIKPVWNYITDTALPALRDAFSTVVGKIGDIWDGLKKKLGTPIKWILDTVINGGLIDGFNKVAAWVGMKGKDGKGALGHVPIPKSLQSYATGGVMPGYTPGRDVHAFYSPTAGRLELSGGEAVMRPEWTAAMGPGYVNYMNSLARRGGVNAIRKALGGQAFAKGGVYLPQPDDAVMMNGMRISRIAAAQVALAKKLFGIPFYLMQGGYGGNNVAASGTSHNYPGVGDFGPGTIAGETALRKVGFAAWARNIAGRMMVGSGAHIHAASLLDPGNRNDPQVYGSWPNHGNGLSGYDNDPAPHPAWVPNLLTQIAKVTGSEIKAIAGATPGGGGGSIPKSIMAIIKNPLGAVKSWITEPLKSAKAMASPMFDAFSKVPLLAAKKMTDKVWDVIPGWAKTAAGWAGDGAEWVVGGVKNAGHAIAEGASDVAHGIGHGAGAVAHALGFANGGILPYNGTMMYDNGGYLPPGLTSVVNLTGKPEPVFTNDQWANIGDGAPGAPGVHYEPHFHKSDLTARDVAFDLDVEFNRLSRKSKRYGG